MSSVPSVVFRMTGIPQPVRTARRLAFYHRPLTAGRRRRRAPIGVYRRGWYVAGGCPHVARRFAMYSSIRGPEHRLPRRSVTVVIAGTAGHRAVRTSSILRSEDHGPVEGRYVAGSCARRRYSPPLTGRSPPLPTVTQPPRSSCARRDSDADISGPVAVKSQIWGSAGAIDDILSRIAQRRS